MEISGQEMMTFDKVTLRMNFVCSYRVTDPVRAFSAAEDPEKLIRAQVQLALRDHIGRYRLDELLENRDSVSEKVLEILREKEETYAVSFLEAGVKDLILPGEIRDIMNTVLLAEKRAQANVITRREEVASTRSLLNTARLMDENQTLYKLNGCSAFRREEAGLSPPGGKPADQPASLVRIRQRAGSPDQQPCHGKSSGAAVPGGHPPARSAGEGQRPGAVWGKGQAG